MPKKNRPIEPNKPLPQKKAVTDEKQKNPYLFAFRLYGIVCNNSVRGGDCYGETSCGNDYSRNGVGKQCLHRDWICPNDQCQVKVCECCYGGNCPSCRKMETNRSEKNV